MIKYSLSVLFLSIFTTFAIGSHHKHLALIGAGAHSCLNGHCSALSTIETKFRAISDDRDSDTPRISSHVSLREKTTPFSPVGHPSSKTGYEACSRAASRLKTPALAGDGSGGVELERPACVSASRVLAISPSYPIPIHFQHACFGPNSTWSPPNATWSSLYDHHSQHRNLCFRECDDCP